MKHAATKGSSTSLRYLTSSTTAVAIAMPMIRRIILSVFQYGRMGFGVLAGYIGTGGKSGAFEQDGFAPGEGPGEGGRARGPANNRVRSGIEPERQSVFSSRNSSAGVSISRARAPARVPVR